MPPREKGKSKIGKCSLFGMTFESMKGLTLQLENIER